MWAYRFEEHGGYECTSSAYIISQNGEDRITLDTRDFPGFDFKNWDLRYLPNKEVEDLAHSIVGHLNYKEGNSL